MTNNPPPDEKESVGSGVSRRSFLAHLGLAGVAVAAGHEQAAAKTETQSVSTGISESAIDGAIETSFKVNGQQKTLKIDPRTTLLDCLRENLNITGTKKGCDHGQCGACTVHLDGQRINSCLTLAVMCNGHEVTTIEGLGSPENLHPVQKAFIDCDAYQCGYCTSGQIMSTAALLKEGCPKDKHAIREALSGNICRCGAYNNILSAVLQARDAV